MIDFNMQGHGVYVWSAYGITLAVFIINIIFTFKEKRQIKRILKNEP